MPKLYLDQELKSRDGKLLPWQSVTEYIPEFIKKATEATSKTLSDNPNVRNYDFNYLVELVNQSATVSYPSLYVKDVLNMALDKAPVEGLDMGKLKLIFKIGERIKPEETVFDITLDTEIKLLSELIAKLPDNEPTSLARWGRTQVCMMVEGELVSVNPEADNGKKEVEEQTENQREQLENIVNK